MSDVFSNKLNEPDSPVVYDFSHTGNNMIVAFGGIWGAMAGVPPFEFFNLTKEIRINKLYIRDLNQSWYHSGLPGLADNIEQVASFLLKKKKESGAEKIVLFGSSMGGYAAILFGILINAHAAHAFGPQTFINRFNRIRYGDKRWKEQIKRVHKVGDKKYFDIQQLLKVNRSKCEINIYYGRKHRLDKIHSERIKNSPNVYLHPYEEEGHTVAKYLKDSGILKDIIMNSLC